MNITENSILVIRGRISRQPNDSGLTALVLNECPRLVLTGGLQVLGRIGQPIPLIKACEQNKYADYNQKYPGSTYFSILYSLDFQQKYF